MALNKAAQPVELAAAAAAETAALQQAVARSPEDKRVRGQVRMHAIVCGYKVASVMAATLATSPDSMRAELHKLAAEVAEKIESYSFAD